MSFQQTNLVEPPTWVGLDNFRAVLADPLLPTAVRNTAYFALLALLFGYPVPLIAAVLMSEVRRGAGSTARSPTCRSSSRRSSRVLLWKFFYDAEPDRRLQHDPRLGRTSARIPGCSRSTWAMPSLVLEATWAAAGGTVIIYLAALTGVPASCTTPPRSTAPASGARSGTSRCRSCAASCSSR